MANRKIAGELNELLKSPGGTKGVRTLSSYNKGRESGEGSDTNVESESNSEGDSKRKEDDSAGKPSGECSGEKSEADSKRKDAASSRNQNSSKSAEVDSDSKVEKTERDSEGELLAKQGNKNDDRADKQCGIKSTTSLEKTCDQSKQQKTEKQEISSIESSESKSKVVTRPVIGPELLLSKEKTSGFSSTSSTVTQESKRTSFHERYTRKEVTDCSSSTESKEVESADVNSNVKKVPMIGKMGFSLDLNKELNAKFAAARQQMTGSMKKQMPVTATTPTEGKKQPPVPLPRPKKSEGKTSFEVKRERSKRGLLVDPEENKEEQIEGSSTFMDLDTGHIYEDIDMYQKPGKCEACNPESTDVGKEANSTDPKKDVKKKKKSKLRMLCMCRQTSGDLPSATLSEKSDSKTCLLPSENQYMDSDKNEAGEAGYERLQKQKASFRGGYEALRNSSPEVEAEKQPPEGAKPAGTVTMRQEVKNESTRSGSVVSNEQKFSSQSFEKHTSKQSSYESKNKSSTSKSLSKSVRFEEKSEEIAKHSTEEQHSSTKMLGVDTKRKEVLYAKVMKTSHKSEHSESVVKAEETSSTSHNMLQKFGAVPVLPLEGRLSLIERDNVDSRFTHESSTSTRHIVNGGEIVPTAEINLNVVPETALLDTSANKGKAQLASSGALANRRPPTKGGALSGSNDEDEDEEPFVHHDRDNASDTSSISQTSYDPSKPMFSGMASEIPDSTPSTTDDASAGGVVLLSSKSKGDASIASGVRSLFGGKSSSGGGGGGGGGGSGGITLLSSRPLSASHGDVPTSTARGGSSKGDGGIVLLSSKSLNTGYEKAGSMNALPSSGGMVGEYDMSSRGHSYDFASGTLSADNVNAGSKRPSQYSSRPVNEWTTQQVCHWLLGINMDHYAAEFMAKGIDGNQLLTLDGAKLKILGVNNSNDKNVIKKRIKDLKSAIEKERKQQEKAQKAKEKLEGKGKKKFGFGK